MKKSIVFIFFALLFSWDVHAQDMELEINYIAHDHFNAEFLDKVDEIYMINRGSRSRKTYLYLANADTPEILVCNTAEQKEFDTFKYNLNSQLKHNVWPEVDLKKLVELLESDDFIDDNGNPLYSYFTLNFYITSSFWLYNYQETLIARLFWILELADKENVIVNIYHPEGDPIQYDPDNMLGVKRLNGDYNLYMFTF